MIDIYSKPNCPYCDKAKMVFKGYRVQFNEYVVGSDISREQFFEKFPGKKTVPQIIINGQHVGGYDELTEWIKENDLRNVLSG